MRALVFPHPASPSPLPSLPHHLLRILSSLPHHCSSAISSHSRIITDSPAVPQRTPDPLTLCLDIHERGSKWSQGRSDLCCSISIPPAPAFSSYYDPSHQSNPGIERQSWVHVHPSPPDFLQDSSTITH
uniref:Uncharacterized protein n=1 Tax=Knipowitschia caucasica TaxID=637954 RepID=A0AAV2KBG2_KNICA